MTTPTPCVPEFQVATARDAWERYYQRGATYLSPADYVAVGFTATGTCDARGVPEFAPDWTDVASAVLLGS